MTRPRLAVALAVAVLAVWATVHADPPQPAKPVASAEGAKFFTQDVLPILQAQCLRCHGAEPKVKGGFAKDVRGGNLKGADAVGRTIAERSIEKGIKRVVFDRSGFLYHGRIRAVADAARKAGLEF